MSAGHETRYVLAIDHGTSGMKPAIVSTKGEVIGFEFEPTPVHLYPGGGAEQNPVEWWTAFLKASKRLLERRLVPDKDIVAVCDTSQWSGTVTVDENNNNIGNAIIWMDSRGAPYIDRALKGHVKIAGYPLWDVLRWLRKTGGIAAHSGKDPIAHILYLKHEHPEVYKQARWFLEPTDYINLRLTGKVATSVATVTLLWLANTRDINKVHYDNSLIKRMKIDKTKLPPIMRSVDVLGPLSKEVANQLGLTQDVKVVVGAADVPSSIIGSGAVRDFEGHVYIGTSTWISCHVPFKKTDIGHNFASVPSAVPGRYFIADEQESGGACLTYLRDKVFYPDDPDRFGKREVYQEFDRVVEQVPAGSGKVIFTPWLYGERTPVEDRNLRGAFNNLSLETDRGQLIRAVFEGIAYNSRWLLGVIEAFIKRPMDPLNMIGGGAQSDIWCQIYADVLGRTIQQVENPVQANARGAAFIAAVGLGYAKIEDIPKLTKISKTFKPNPKNRRIYDVLYGEFLNIYKTNKLLYRRLNASPEA
ncbi:MAG: xylulose kinase [Candidatus Thorarchaeota archaeon]|nr:MAG: xylulose kinase [Candidatus Thorarchaeota archaeon]